MTASVVYEKTPLLKFRTVEMLLGFYFPFVYHIENYRVSNLGGFFFLVQQPGHSLVGEDREFGVALDGPDQVRRRQLGRGSTQAIPGAFVAPADQGLAHELAGLQRCDGG